MSIWKFCYYLEGRNFTAFTDHKPLTFDLSKNTDKWSARQHRHLNYICELTTDIQHISGKDNPVAEALSCINFAAIQEELDYEQMA